jgi:hypothetical protein
LQPFSQTPFLARIPLLHKQAHESFDVSRLIQYEIPVLLDLRADHVRYHAVHSGPSELTRYGCREYSATRRISHSTSRDTDISPQMNADERRMRKDEASWPNGDGDVLKYLNNVTLRMN